MLISTVRLPSHLGYFLAAPAAGELGSRSAVAQLEQAVGNVLKQSSAASSGAGSAVWGLYADYYAALGFHASAREALLKQACLHLGNGVLLCWILVPEKLVLLAGISMCQRGRV